MVEGKFYRESNGCAMKETEKFRTGVALFNARKFFEAHEVWEELWLAAAEPEKTFLQGLIQLAAAFHHQGRRNLQGTQSLLAAGLAKLERFPDDHRGLALGELRKAAKDWAEGEAVRSEAGAGKPPKVRMTQARRKKKRSG
jgi:predicted metal-dependent hydrolase